LGTVEVTAVSRDEAVEKMENELRYRLEMCPCTGQAFRNLEIELVEK
jgi:acylphosphatase